MNRKAVSEMIAYVLLIVIAVGISILVYSFLKSYVPVKEINCPENVAIAIDNYECYSEGGDHKINITLKNTGTFNIYGYIIRLKAIKTSDEKASIITYDSIEDRETSKIQTLGVGNITKGIVIKYNLYNSVENIEVEPFRLENGKIVLCKNSIISEGVIHGSSTGC